MKFDSVVGAANLRKTRAKAEKSVGGFLIKRTSTTPFLGNVLSNPEEITLVLNPSDGRQRDLIPSIPIGVCAKVAEFGDAAILEEKITEGENHVYTTLIPIEVGVERGLRVRNGEDLTLTVDNLINGATYEIIGEEAAETGTNYGYISPVAIPAGTKLKPLDLEKHILVIFPNNPAIKQVQVTYVFPTGENAVVNYSIDEIRKINADLNAVEGIRYDKADAKQVIFGGGHAEYLALNAVNIDKIEVTTDGTALTLYTVSPDSRLF